MEDIVIKTIENGFLVSVGAKSYISSGDARSLNKLINKILGMGQGKEKDTPPPAPKESVERAKKVGLK
jgi:hypothetical protein